MKMSEGRRELMLRIIDGRSEIPPIMFHFQHLRKCDDALSWLIAHGFTGKQFLALFKNFGNSPLQIMGFVLTQLKREKEYQPIIAGKDYLLR